MRKNIKVMYRSAATLTVPDWAQIKRISTDADYRAYSKLYLQVFGDTLGRRFALMRNRERVFKQGYVWWLDGECVGIFSLNVDEHEVWNPFKVYRVLYNFALTPSVRGKGYGKILLSSVISEAERLGCDDVLLKVDMQNSVAVNLYTSFGFRFVD